MHVIGFTEHTINVFKYNPLGGSSYIELPKEHAAKKNGLVNIQNIKLCHFAHKFPAIRDKNRVTKYTKHEKDVDYTGITFPVTLNQISKIEK